MEDSLLCLDVLYASFKPYFLLFIEGFPSDFNPFSPGLEVKFALHEAEKNGADVCFGGS